MQEENFRDDHVPTLVTTDVRGIIVASEGRLPRGPRLPKPDLRKLKRKRAKAARKRNRGAYSGQ